MSLGLQPPQNDDGILYIASAYLILIFHFI